MGRSATIRRHPGTGEGRFVTSRSATPRATDLAACSGSTRIASATRSARNARAVRRGAHATAAPSTSAVAAGGRSRTTWSRIRTWVRSIRPSANPSTAAGNPSTRRDRATNADAARGAIPNTGATSSAVARTGHDRPGAADPDCEPDGFRDRSTSPIAVSFPAAQ